MKILTGQAAQQYKASGQPYLPANQMTNSTPSLTQDSSQSQSNTSYQPGTRLQQFGQSPIEQLLLGATKPLRGIASQAVQLGQSVGDIIGQLGQGKSLNDALASTNISDRSGTFMVGDEQQMAKENPLMMGAQNAAGLAAYGIGGPSSTFAGSLGKGALSGALGGFSAANKVEEMPETMLAGAGMGSLLSGGMYGLGKAKQALSNRIEAQPMMQGSVEPNKLLGRVRGDKFDKVKLTNNQMLEMRDYMDSVNGIDTTLKPGTVRFNKVQGEIGGMLEGWGIKPKSESAFNTTVERLLDTKRVNPVLGIEPKRTASQIFGKVTSSSNPYNAKFEAITKTYKGQELQNKLRQFISTLPKNDPLADSIRNTAKSLFGINSGSV